MATQLALVACATNSPTLCTGDRIMGLGATDCQATERLPGATERQLQMLRCTDEAAIDVPNECRSSSIQARIKINSWKCDATPKVQGPEEKSQL